MSKLYDYRAAKRRSMQTKSMFAKKRNFSKKLLKGYLGLLNSFCFRETTSNKEFLIIRNSIMNIHNVIDKWDEESVKFGLKPKRFRNIEEAKQELNVQFSYVFETNIDTNL
jgi:hypothetical protein